MWRFLKRLRNGLRGFFAAFGESDELPHAESVSIDYTGLNDAAIFIAPALDSTSYSGDSVCDSSQSSIATSDSGTCSPPADTSSSTTF